MDAQSSTYTKSDLSMAQVKGLALGLVLGLALGWLVSNWGWLPGF